MHNFFRIKKWPKYMKLGYFCNIKKFSIENNRPKCENWPNQVALVVGVLRLNSLELMGPVFMNT
jgi:hypothetical protein